MYKLVDLPLVCGGISTFFWIFLSTKMFLNMIQFDDVSLKTCGSATNELDYRSVNLPLTKSGQVPRVEYSNLCSD